MADRSAITLASLGLLILAMPTTSAQGQDASSIRNVNAHVQYLHAPADVTPHTHSPNSTCEHPDIIAQLGGIVLMVPRKGLRYTTTADPAVIHAADTDCALTRISDVIYLGAEHVAGWGFNIGTVTKDVDGIAVGNYRTWQRRVQKFGDNRVVTLSNGLKKFTLKWLEMYLLPLETAPTANGEPVVFDCTGNAANRRDPTNFCAVSYIHPDGLGFSYFFFRKRIPEDQYLAHDQAVRHVYEKAKADAEALGGSTVQGGRQ